MPVCFHRVDGAKIVGDSSCRTRCLQHIAGWHYSMLLGTLFAMQERTCTLCRMSRSRSCSRMVLIEKCLPNLWHLLIITAEIYDVSNFTNTSRTYVGHEEAHRDQLICAKAEFVAMSRTSFSEWVNYLRGKPGNGAIWRFFSTNDYVSPFSKNAPTKSQMMRTTKIDFLHAKKASRYR